MSPLRFTDRSIRCASLRLAFADMQENPVPIPVLAAARSACVVESELLNSERIASAFGSYGNEVLSSANGIRRSSLYSGDGDDRTCRTYALVRFEDVPANIANDEHAKILAGSSIGAIFKANGWDVYKETLYVGELALPADEHRLRGLMRLEQVRSIALHVYRLYLRKKAQVIEYATVIESHHPDYLSRQQLEQLYIVDAPTRLSENELIEVSELVLEAG